MSQWRYKTIEDAPAHHREMARLRAHNMPWKDIAAAMGVSEGTARCLGTHKPFKEHVEKLKSSSALLSSKVKRNLEDIAELGTEHIKRMLDSGDLQANEAIRATEMALDRHPSGEFVKQSRTQVDGSVEHMHHVTAAAIQDIKSRARKQLDGEVVNTREYLGDDEEWDASETEAEAEDSDGLGGREQWGRLDPPYDGGDADGQGERTGD